MGGATVDLMMVAVAWMAGWLAGRSRGAGRGQTKQAVCIRGGLVYHLPISQTTTNSDTSGIVHPPFTYLGTVPRYVGRPDICCTH